MTPEYGSWLSGFIDGEGCFVLNRRHLQGENRIQPRFRLQLRDDDTELLVEAQAITGLGLVSFYPARAMGSATVCWDIRDRESRHGLIELLDAYPLRSKKRHDYVIWREACQVYAQIVNNRRTINANGAIWDRLHELHQDLMAVRRYQPPVKETHPCQ